MKIPVRRFKLKINLHYIKIFALVMGMILMSGCGNDSENEKGADVKKIVSKQDAVKDISKVEIKIELSNYLRAYDKALTLWQTPIIEKNIKTKFGDAHIIICGVENGEPLVLLHGMNASSTMWYPNIELLSTKYRIYAIDFLLEPGKSSCNGNIDETSQTVSWYYEIFDKLELKKVSLLGASRGGWLAVNIALKHKERINKIVLLSPAQTFAWIKPGADIIKNVIYSISPKRKRLREVLETMSYNVDSINQVFIDQYYIATKKATINKCFAQMTPFSNAELESLKMPILLLIGDKDIINNRKSIEKAKKHIDNVLTGVIANAGHFLSIDQPEKVNKIIFDFLNKR